MNNITKFFSRKKLPLCRDEARLVRKQVVH